MKGGRGQIPANPNPKADKKNNKKKVEKKKAKLALIKHEPTQGK